MRMGGGKRRREKTWTKRTLGKGGGEGKKGAKNSACFAITYMGKEKKKEGGGNDPFLEKRKKKGKGKDQEECRLIMEGATREGGGRGGV